MTGANFDQSKVSAGIASDIEGTLSRLRSSRTITKPYVGKAAPWMIGLSSGRCRITSRDKSGISFCFNLHEGDRAILNGAATAMTGLLS
jgi:hypothetical protein